MTQQAAERQDKTVHTLIDQSKRTKNVPIRNDFVQITQGKSRRPGLMGQLISTKNGRSLDLYLMHRLVASAEPWDTTRDADVWARCLGLSEDEYGRSTVSRCWAKLESYGLISKGRVGRRAKITSLHENGKLDPYTRPTGRFFTLPLAYWTEDWYRRLSYPGKAVLLISSSLGPGFYLPGPKAKPWYGISEDTLRKGFTELEQEKLITHENRAREDWGQGDILTHQRHYTLARPFGKELKESVSVFGDVSQRGK